MRSGSSRRPYLPGVGDTAAGMTPSLREGSDAQSARRQRDSFRPVFARFTGSFQLQKGSNYAQKFLGLLCFDIDWSGFRS